MSGAEPVREGDVGPHIVRAAPLPGPDGAEVRSPDVRSPDVRSPDGRSEADVGNDAAASSDVGAVRDDNVRSDAGGSDLAGSGLWCLAVLAGVEMALPSQYPEIVLQEKDEPWRELRIPVGMAEGTAISYAWKGIATPRPLTHELFTEVITRHDVRIEAVRITARRDGNFLAELDTSGRRGTEVVPCRPSDAIALMLRQPMPTPLLVADWLFTEAAGD
jgi:bifunctional DNase/RNase